MYPPVAELPPRARRIHAEMKRQQRLWGTTSACAENTLYTSRSDEPPGNYLRVRGEYSMFHLHYTLKEELPPRARRIRLASIPPRCGGGTTSACAENTFPDRGLAGIHGNYLRVRGEYSISDAELLERLELPPRARRIRVRGSVSYRKDGTTSACAENTWVRSGEILTSWNYLRVRGEYKDMKNLPHVITELPPRARRIHAEMKRQQRLWGTTSACAENTNRLPAGLPAGRNYLRVRGEYGVTASMAMRNTELPPRARRIHAVTGEVPFL